MARQNNNSSSQKANQKVNDELRERGKALARGILLLERHRKARRASLLKEFLQDPVEFVISNEYCKADDNKYAKQIALYAVEELQRQQGILHTHRAMNQAGTTLNVVRWMHLATFIIGNILLFGTAAFILYALKVKGGAAIPRLNELIIPLGAAGGTGIVLNILYFVWVGPALRIRRALSDTAQLEMAYKTYTLVANKMEELDKAEIIKEKDGLKDFTRDLVDLIERSAEPRSLKPEKKEKE